MPKKYLHDILADHTDADYGFRGKGAAVAALGYDCGFHHQVAESPFTETPLFAIPGVPTLWPPILEYFLYTDPVRGFGAGADVRGPPALAFNAA